jgi:outer membrane protein
MKYKTLISTIALASGLALTAQPASAVEKGDWLLRFGVVNVNPNDGSDASSSLGLPADAIGVDDNTQLYINATWMFSDNMGLDILGATPFTHDITLDGAGKIGETKHLPPTVGIQYHFSPKSNVRPYVGAGINYTTFFSEELDGGGDLSLDDSWGLAAQAGVDVDINDKWFFNADLRYMNIETTATLSGPVNGSVDVQINPWVIGLGVGTRF